MTDGWLTMWNDRYRKAEYAYGVDPNVYLKERLDTLTPGSILFPAEGEGRNGIYAATQGWTVSSFDISVEAQKKAVQLAKQNNVTIEYRVGHLPELNFKPHQFDVIALIYAHFPPDIRDEYFKILNQLLKPGGTIIFEAFGSNHLEYREQNPKVGGPGDLRMLFSTDELHSYFPDYEVLELEEKEIELNEGQYHIGTGSVVRFFGRKQ